MITETDFNQSLALLNNEVPMALLPLRLETRYVRQWIGLTDLSHVIHEVYVQIDATPFESNNPTLVYEKISRLGEQIAQLQTALERENNDSLEKLDVWELSASTGKWPQFAADSVATLRASIAQMEKQQQSLSALQNKLLKKPIASTQESSPRARMSAPIKKNLDQAQQTISAILKNTNDVEHLTATELLQAQMQLERLISQLISALPITPNEWDAWVKPFVGPLQNWLRSSAEAIPKFKGLPDLLQIKLDQAGYKLMETKEKQVTGSDYEGVASTWQGIQKFRAAVVTFEKASQSEQISVLETPVEQVSAVINELLLALSALKKGELDPIFSIQIFQANNQLSQAHQKIREKWKALFVQAENLLASVSRNIQQIKSILDEPDCDGEQRISRTQLDQLYQFKSFLEKTPDSSATYFSQNLDALTLQLQISHEILSILINQGQLCCSDCDELRYLLGPLLEKINAIQLSLQEAVSTVETQFAAISPKLSAMQALASNLNRYLDQGPEVQVWSLVEGLGLKIFPLPDYLVLRGENRVELLVITVDAVMKKIIDLFTLVKEADPALQKAIAEILGHVDWLLDELGPIQLFWEHYFGHTKKRLAWLLSNLSDLSHIEISPCDDQSFEKIKRFTAHVQQSFKDLVPESETDVPSIEEREVCLSLAEQLLSKLLQIERSTKDDQQAIKNAVNFIQKKLAWLDKLYSDEAVLLQKLGKRIDAKVKLLHVNAERLEKQCASLTNADLNFSIWKYAAFIQIYHDFKVSGYPSAADPKQQVEVLQLHLKDLKLPQSLRPEVKASLEQSISIAKRILEMESGTSSSRLENYRSLNRQLIELHAALSQQKEITESDSAPFALLESLDTIWFPIFHLLQWMDLGEYLPIQALKTLKDATVSLKNQYDQQQQAPRRALTVYYHFLNKYLKSLKKWFDFAVQDLEQAQQKNAELQGLFISYQNEERLFWEKLSTVQLPRATTIEQTEQVRQKRKVSAPLDQNEKLQLADFYRDGDVELWVRVYPDNIAIENHDTRLTQAEIEAGKIYWQKAVEAGNNTNLKLSAWRVLAATYGAHRAAWIVKQLKPTKIDEVVDGAESAKMKSSLSANQASELAGGRKILTFPTIIPRTDPWANPSSTNVLPDRLAFCIYRTMDSNPEYHFGEPIPASLQVGLNHGDDTELDSSADGKLQVGGGIKWLTDFSEAVNKGMAIRIPMGKTAVDFAKIIVVGAKTNFTETTPRHLQSKTALETLFQSHRYSSGGLGLVPPGTPTNNTGESDSGYNYMPDVDQVFYTEIEGIAFTPTSNLNDRADGQVIADALGLDGSVFQKIPYADGFTVRNAGIMNYCLWDGTMGYWLGEMFSFYDSGDHIFGNDPNSLPDDLEAVRSFIVENVKGRGGLPTLRVGSQPYGILPIARLQQAPFKYIKLPEEPEYDENGYEIPGVDAVDLKIDQAFSPFFDPGFGDWLNWSNNPGFSIGLANLLIALKAKWNESAQRHVFNIDALPTGKDFQESFMQILGLLPNAAQFYNRYGIGLADKALKDALFENTGGNYYNEINFKEGFPAFLGSNSYDVPLSAIETDTGFNWPWTKVVDDVNVNYNASFLTFAQLRFFDGYQQLVGNTVDNLKPSEKRKLSKINVKGNYIDWLNNASVDEIYDAIRTGKLPSDSLLFLMLANSILNAYFEAAMRIYQKMGPNQDQILTDFRYTALMDKAFGNWEWRKRKLLEIDGRLSEITDPFDNAFALNVLTYLKNLSVGMGPSDVFSDLLKSGEPLSRKAYRNFPIDWHPQSLFAMKFGTLNYYLDNDIFTDLANVVYPGLNEDYALINANGDITEPNIPLPSNPLIGANSRHLFLSLILEPGDVPEISSNSFGVGLLPVDNSMGNYLKRDSTLNTHYQFETAWVKRLHDYLPILSGLPTAELERLMAEHLDLCSHRLDAWMLGLVNQSLWWLRYSMPNKEGLYIGAYGYLENLKPGNPNVVFRANGDKPFTTPVNDPTNQGHIHAPSLAHATTAAVLRSGYLATGTGNNLLQIDLSSRRVKKALWYLDGIRNGQELGALLGYQFERGLHDLVLDEYILDFRNEFPLRAGTLAPNAGLPIETLQANNVVDGLALAKKWRLVQKGNTGLQAGFVSFPIAASVFQKINQQIEQMDDALDAIGDLAISEGVFQMAKGNFTRSAAVQKAFNEGGLAPEMEIVQTPRSGQVLTHRAGLIFDPSNVVLPASWAGIPISARAKAEPVLNRWLAEQIGAPKDIRCELRLTLQSDPDTDEIMTVGLDDLRLQPYDLVLLLSTSFEEPESELGKRLFQLAWDDKTAKNETIISFDVIYDAGPSSDSETSFAAISPYFSTLYQLISNARPMLPGDLVHPSDPSTASLFAGFGSRVTDLKVDFSNCLSSIGDALGPLQAHLGNAITPGSNVALDASLVQNMVNRLWDAVQFNLPEAIFNISGPIDLNVAKACLERGKLLQTTMNGRLAEYNKIISNSKSVSPNERHLKAAQAILGEVFQMLPTFDLPNPAEFQSALLASDETLPQDNLMVMEQWLDGVSRVREPMSRLEQAILQRELFLGFASVPLQPKPVQLPYRPNDNWVGMELPGDYFSKHSTDTIQVSRDKLSLVMLLAETENNIANWSTSDSAPVLSGLLLDEWAEVIPFEEQTTGIAFHYNQPNMEAPNTILLPLPAYSTARWSLGHLLNNINDAFDLAKIRAVEPEQNAAPMYVRYNHIIGGFNGFLSTWQKYVGFHASHLFPATLNRVVNFSKENDLSVDFNINHKNMTDPGIDHTIFPFIVLPNDVSDEIDNNLENNQN